jgi:hypothetical protein
MTVMTPPGVGRRIAHDPGDPLVTSHCPFCGSGQVVGRSDGTIGCDFCGQNYIVRVQPAFPGMPQMPTGPGAPSDAGPDGGLVDPGMVGPDGMPVDPAAGDGPPPGDADPGDEPLEDPDGGGGPPAPGDDDDSDPTPPPKGKSKKKSSRLYRGVSGQPLNEDQFVRHIAVQASCGDPRVLATLRAESARRRVTAGKYHVTLPTGHHVSIDQHGPDWYGKVSHPASSQVHYMHLGQGGDPRAAAEQQLSRGPASAFIRSTTPGQREEEAAAPSQWWNTPQRSFEDAPFHASRKTAAMSEQDKARRGHYQRGWRASERAAYWNGEGESALERADWKNEPHAWYQGYHDNGSGRPKFHSLDCPGTGDHDGENGCTLK